MIKYSQIEHKVPMAKKAFLASVEYTRPTIDFRLRLVRLGDREPIARRFSCALSHWLKALPSFAASFREMHPTLAITHQSTFKVRSPRRLTARILRSAVE